MTSLLLAISVALNGHWVTVGEPPADGVEVFVVIEWLDKGIPVKRLIRTVDGPQAMWWQYWTK